jgi:hypothetical protein
MTVSIPALAGGVGSAAGFDAGTEAGATTAGVDIKVRCELDMLG